MNNQVLSSTENISVSWSDDDYTTYNGSGTVNVSASNDFPFITQLGRFRQRSFKLSANPAQGARLRMLEMDINKGQQ